MLECINRLSARECQEALDGDRLGQTAVRHQAARDSNDNLNVDVRVVAATNVNLQEMVAQERFAKIFSISSQLSLSSFVRCVSDSGTYSLEQQSLCELSFAACRCAGGDRATLHLIPARENKRIAKCHGAGQHPVES